VDLTEAIIQAKLGNSVAFLGAGFSTGATNDNGEAILAGDDFRAAVSSALGIKEWRELQLVTELYDDEFGSQGLKSLVQKSFVTGSPSNGQKIIASLPWKRIYTTNYDDVFEKASGDKYYSAVISDAPDSLPRNRPAVVHLHGQVQRSLKESSSAETFLLTMSSYLRNPFPSSPWVPVFRNDLRFSQSIIFIGYSLSDLDVSRVVFDEALRQKTFIIVRPDTDELEIRRLGKFGTPVKMWVDEFADFISSTELIGGQKTEAPLIAFEHFQAPDLPKEATQDAYVDLLMRGVFDHSEYAFEQSNSSPTYATPRSELSLIRDDTKRRYLVHSNLGNGKTIFLDQAASVMAERGYTVYLFRRNTDTGTAEIDQIISSDNRICLIFDNLNRCRDLVSYAAHRIGPTDAMIVSCRSITYEIEKKEISSSLQGEFVEVELNTLDRTEASHFNEVFTSFGIWGEDSYLRPEKRVEIIRVDCAGEIRSVVLRAFRNGIIAEKLHSWAKELSALDERDQEVTLAVILATLVHADVTLIDLSDLLGIRYDQTKKTLSNSIAGEIIGVSGIYADVRSAVLSEYLVRQCFAPETVLRIMTKLVRSLSEWAHSGSQYKDFIRELMRFAVVGRIFEGTQKKDFIVSFYEGIRSLDYCRSNPAFWLQYAMARMAREEYALAGTMLETAEGRARTYSGYNLFQIHNQKARYLLLSRSRTDNYTDYDSAYIKAFQIINAQIRDGKGKRDPYPLRLIPPNEEFISKRGKELSSGTVKLAIQLLQNFTTAFDDYAAGTWRDERGWRPSLAATRAALDALG